MKLRILACALLVGATACSPSTPTEPPPLQPIPGPNFGDGLSIPRP